MDSLDLDFQKFKAGSVFRSFTALFEPPYSTSLRKTDPSTLEDRANKTYKILKDIQEKSNDYSELNQFQHDLNNIDELTKEDAIMAKSFTTTINGFSNQAKTLIKEKAGKSLLPEFTKLSSVLDNFPDVETLSQLNDFCKKMKDDISKSEILTADDKKNFLKKLDIAPPYATAVLALQKAPQQDKSTVAKQQFRILFNTVDPETAIQFAVKNKIIEDGPEKIGNYLYEAFNDKTLDSKALGRFLYKEGSKYLPAYLENLSYKQANVLQALRKTYRFAPLASDVQDLDKLFEEMTNVFSKQNQCTEGDKKAFSFLAKQLFILQNEKHYPSATNPVDYSHFNKWFPYLSNKWKQDPTRTPLQTYTSRSTLHDYYLSLKGTALTGSNTALFQKQPNLPK